MFKRISALTAGMLIASSAAFATDSCVPPGTWKTSPDFGPDTHTEIVTEAATRPVVLLGESHDNMEHHRWQLQMISALHARNNNVVLGFEMFPRRLQPALDLWYRGDIDEKTFLEQSEWTDVWGHDPALYMPIFHFARMNRIPMIALNVEQSLVRAVGEKGWDAVPEDQKEGVRKPAPAPEDYRDFLKKIYGYKAGSAHGENPHKAEEEKEEIDLDNDPGFQHFVEAQLTWDGAMAQKIHDAQTAGGNPEVIAIMGSGHLVGKDGVPHQLKSLGIDNAAVFLPWNEDSGCDEWSEDLADAVFGVSLPDAVAGAETSKPRLGVRISPAENGVKVEEVVARTVAAASGIENGDIITSAAGFATSTTGELVDVIQRQAPGTILPLTILRGEETLEIMARFPQAF